MTQKWTKMTKKWPENDQKMTQKITQKMTQKRPKKWLAKKTYDYKWVAITNDYDQ
jgi:hypothetical protein